MKDTWMEKGLVISVILLFIVVAVAPTINYSIVKASTDNDFVEVTSQACGIQGYGNTTIRLTKQQYQDLEQYLVEFRARLNQTTTRDEAVPIFKEAVVELNKYGLLPKGMNVERAQKLVVGFSDGNTNKELFQKILRKSKESMTNRNAFNAFCLVTGIVTNSFCFTPFIDLLNTMTKLLILYNADIGQLILILIYFLFIARNLLPSLYLFGQLTFGYQIAYEHGAPDYVSSKGWIFSINPIRVKTWLGDIYGKIKERPFFGAGGPPDYTFYQGISGFTGLKITISKLNFLIGTCLLVNLDSSPITI
jgi:hypothetical protein